MCLTFGYNTAVFNTWQRFKRIPIVINMDGFEWSRSRWGFARQAILCFNERVLAVGDHLIADHPEIARYLWTGRRAQGLDGHLRRRRAIEAHEAAVVALGLEPGGTSR